MNFPSELLLPSKTIYRNGAALQIAQEALDFGERGLMVHGRSLDRNGNAEKIRTQFPRADNCTPYCHPSGEPTLDDITSVIDAARAVCAEWIVGIGGGSVLDLAKAAAGLFHAPHEPLFYQEGGKLSHRGIPFIAVPTTAGTGSEATSNSVIIDKKKQVKLSIRDKSFLAKKVILDGELLRGIPPTVLSYAAMDAYVQAYESFISRNATWLSDTFAHKAIQLINAHILPAYESGEDDDLNALLLGSYCAGIALAHSRLGVIHGIAHPLGALYKLPHGLICSVCFMPSIKLNHDAMGLKYETMSETVGVDLFERIEVLLDVFKISSPFKGKKIIKKESIIQETLRSGSTAANPKPIRREDVEFLLGELFQS